MNNLSSSSYYLLIWFYSNKLVHPTYAQIFNACDICDNFNISHQFTALNDIIKILSFSFEANKSYIFIKPWLATFQLQTCRQIWIYFHYYWYQCKLIRIFSYSTCFMWSCFSFIPSRYLRRKGIISFLTMVLKRFSDTWAISELTEVRRKQRSEVEH